MFERVAAFEGDSTITNTLPPFEEAVETLVDFFAVLAVFFVLLVPDVDLVLTDTDFFTGEITITPN